MRKYKKRHIIVPALLVVSMVLCLTGCLGKSFDAKRYVQGYLDASTKGIVEDYSAMTGISEEDAKKDYEARLDSEVKDMTSVIKISEELQQTYRELFKKIAGSYKYEVGEAVKGDNMSFTVPVTVHRLKIYKTADDETQKKLKKKLEKQMKKSSVSDANEFSVWYLETLAEELTKGLEKLEYADPETITLHVGLNNEENVYEIAQADIQSLYDALDDVDNMEAAE